MKEREIIKKIDARLNGNPGIACRAEHITNEDFKVIRAALSKCVPEEPIDLETDYCDMILSCPNCKKPVMSVWAPTFKPACCQFCGQRLKAK